MNKRSLYLGGGFRDHQILYMIPIIEGICSRKKLPLLFLKMIYPKNLFKKKIYSNFFKNYNIKSVDQIQKNQNNIIIILKTLFFSTIFLCLSYLINRKLLLKKAQHGLIINFFIQYGTHVLLTIKKN